MLIGLSGIARSGKDTAAEYLVKEKGFTRVAFADPIREALYRLNPIISVPGMAGARLKQMVDLTGWEEVKDASADVRGLLQRMGTEVGRYMIDPDIWVKLALKEAENHELVVISDVRYPNEVEAIKNAGGKVWRVTRSSVVSTDPHSSEQALNEYNFETVIENEGSIEELYEKIEAILKAEAL